MRLLSVYLGDELVAYGTVHTDATIQQIEVIATKWAGKNNWNRLELGETA